MRRRRNPTDTDATPAVLGERGMAFGKHVASRRRMHEWRRGFVTYVLDAVVTLSVGVGGLDLTRDDGLVARFVLLVHSVLLLAAVMMSASCVAVESRRTCSLRLLLPYPLPNRSVAVRALPTGSDDFVAIHCCALVVLNRDWLEVQLFHLSDRTRNICRRGAGVFRHLDSADVLTAGIASSSLERHAHYFRCCH